MIYVYKSAFADEKIVCSILSRTKKKQRLRECISAEKNGRHNVCACKIYQNDCFGFLINKKKCFTLT